MLHPAVLDDLLDDEVAVARDRLGHRLTTLERRGPMMYAMLPYPGGGDAVIRLDGTYYDGQPFQVMILRNGAPVQPGEWNGVVHSLHPVLQRPFLCMQGTFEYHCYPGHTVDPWDASRTTKRLADLVDHILTKAGR